MSRAFVCIRLLTKAEQMGKEEARIKEIFDADPQGFDGSRATARMITINYYNHRKNRRQHHVNYIPIRLHPSAGYPAARPPEMR